MVSGAPRRRDGTIWPRSSLILALAGALLSTGCVSLLKHFTLIEVSPGIFEGRKPSTTADYAALRARGVRTILSLEQLPWDTWPERERARREGFAYHDVPIMASPLPPHEEQVKRALLLLNDKSLRPIFVHCYLGEDRNTFIIGLYRVYFQDWTPQAAWKEMLRSGFHPALRLKGFETYFWHHTQKPEWVKRLRSAQGARVSVRSK